MTTIPYPEQTWTDATAEQLREQTRQAAVSSEARREREERARREVADRFLADHGGSKNRALRAIGATGRVPIVTDAGETLEPLSSGDILDAHRRGRDHQIDRERQRVLATHDPIHTASRICRDPGAYPAAAVRRARATIQREADDAADRLGIVAGELIAHWLNRRAG